MIKFAVKESDQGEYSIWFIECLEEFGTLKDAKAFMKSLGMKPRDYEVRRQV